MVARDPSAVIPAFQAAGWAEEAAAIRRLQRSKGILHAGAPSRNPDIGSMLQSIG